MISDCVVNVFAYKCSRCGYIWIPRDTDLFEYGGSSFEHADSYTIHKIRPKCCARCKSKVWDQSPKRKRAHLSNISKARVLLFRYRELERAYDLVPSDKDKDRLDFELFRRAIKGDGTKVKEFHNKLAAKSEAGGVK